MEKKFSFRVKYALVLSIFVFAGCTKFVDWDDVWHKHNPNCRIEKIAYHPSFGPETVTGVFSYNKKGDPVSITFDFVATGRPNIIFKYDQKGRLTDYAGPYTNGYYEFWYQYVLDNKGRVIADTVSSFGQVINGKPVYDPNYKPGFGTYEYDEFERLAKVEHHFPYQGYSTMETYEYNSDGNLISHKVYFDGHFAYEDAYNNFDGKVSIYRTSKVFMFVDGNYSRNGFVVAEQYNNKGLPLKYELGRPVAFTFLRTDISSSTITYSCK